MQLPIVATRVTGCVDAVVDGVTGTLVPPRDAAALTAALRSYLDDPELRARHGRAARARALREFDPRAIWDALHAEYVALAGGPVAPQATSAT
jgi:glycosyltransferase involved in cell wall biosynthesis